MDNGEKKHLIDLYIKNMPSLPTSVSKVLEVCNNPQTSPADLNHVISLDPVLVGRVLKLLNSAYYGLGQHLTSLIRAIIMLGINTVKNLALSSAVMGSLPLKDEPRGLDMEGFWRHSLCVGVAAKQLARIRGVDPKLLEEYFAAGLLHDLGKIPLNAVLPKDYVQAVSAADRDRRPLFQEEDRSLGLNHCGTGALIVQAWRLEGPVGDVIIHHHGYAEYRGPHGDLLYTVAAANYFACAEEIGFSGDRYPGEMSPPIPETLGLGGDFFKSVRPVVNREIEKAAVFLKLR
jgi:putative nucleotidyltransferase with HDIG domain